MPRTSETTSVTRAVVIFAVLGMAALLLVTGGTALLLRRTATARAIHNASELARVVDQGIIVPNLTDAVVDGDPAAVRRFDDVVRRQVLIEPVVRIKIWDRSGRIVYSDEPRLVGDRFSLGDEELEALEDGGVDAELSDLSRPENRYDRGNRRLLEVYQGLRTPGGRPVLMETYLRYASVVASSREIWSSFVPALAGALIVLELGQLPLAWSLARRLNERQREREALLQRALDASDLERRRIAQDLHDGVVQSLAGLSFSLSAAADRLAGDADTADSLRAAAATTRETIRSLRTMLVEIYPPSLEQSGLEAALRDLLDEAARRGLATTLESEPPGLDLGPERDRLVFRVAQEAVRNTLAHAGARSVTVRVSTSGVEVADDGKGFDVSAVPSGHFGLRVVRDLVSDAGGHLSVTSSPGGGTTVRAEVPS